MKKLVFAFAFIVACLITALIYNGYQRHKKFQQTVEMNRVLDSLADDMYRFQDSIVENSFK
jgi:ABC-type transporter Mla subunit MlaD